MWDFQGLLCHYPILLSLCTASFRRSAIIRDSKASPWFIKGALPCNVTASVFHLNVGWVIVDKPIGDPDEIAPPTAIKCGKVLRKNQKVSLQILGDVYQNSQTSSILCA